LFWVREIIPSRTWGTHPTSATKQSQRTQQMYSCESFLFFLLPKKTLWWSWRKET
jgi:hypothetical protein